MLLTTRVSTKCSFLAYISSLPYWPGEFHIYHVLHALLSREHVGHEAREARGKVWNMASVYRMFNSHRFTRCSLFWFTNPLSNTLLCNFLLAFWLATLAFMFLPVLERIDKDWCIFVLSNQLFQIFIEIKCDKF